MILSPKSVQPVPPSSPSPRSPRHLVLALAVACAAALACSIAVRRDFAGVSAGTIGWDDMCNLQEYFDTIEAKGARAPALVSAVDLEGQTGEKTIRGGRARFAFETEFQLKHVKRVLNENWRRVPEELAAARRVEIEVKWSERAGVRRVVTDQDAELGIGRETWSLPYQPCLSELIYGEPLYRQRRIMWGLPLPEVTAPASAAKTTVTIVPSPATGPDEAAATSDGGTGDGGPGAAADAGISGDSGRTN
jgi:hypothetical protein